MYDCINRVWSVYIYNRTGIKNSLFNIFLFLEWKAVIKTDNKPLVMQFT